MKKEKKSQIIEDLTALINENPNFYITDIEGLNAVQTAKLRRTCFKQQIKLKPSNGKDELFYLLATTLSNWPKCY